MTDNELKTMLSLPDNFNCPVDDIVLVDKDVKSDGNIRRLFSLLGEVIEVISDPQDENLLNIQPYAIHVPTAVFNEQGLDLNARGPIAELKMAAVTRPNNSIVVRNRGGGVAFVFTDLDATHPEYDFSCLAELEFWITDILLSRIYGQIPPTANLQHSEMYDDEVDMLDYKLVIFNDNEIQYTVSYERV